MGQGSVTTPVNQAEKDADVQRKVCLLSVDDENGI